MPWLVDIPESLLAEVKKGGPQITANFLEFLTVLAHDPRPRPDQPDIERTRPESSGVYAADFGGGVLSYLIDPPARTVRGVSIAWIL